MSGGKTIWKYLLRALGVVVFITLLGVLAASLILAKPQNDKSEISQARPSGEARPAVTIDSENDFIQLASDFPAPVMSFLSGSGMTFVSGVSADTAVSGGFARVVTLCWQTPEGQPMTLLSIWPDTALSLLEGDLHFMPQTGPALFGSPSVRMENDDSIRLHVARDQALYVVLLPRALSGQVSDLCRSLQRFTVNPQTTTSLKEE